MKQERKMVMAVTKVSFAEAEAADDNYWAETSFQERLNTLFDLRYLVFGPPKNRGRIKKQVIKKSRYA